MVRSSVPSRYLLPETTRSNFTCFDSLGQEYVFDQLLTAHVEHKFDAGGIGKFRILGIEESAMLSPSDPTAFPTGIEFTETGTVNMTMGPVRGFATTLLFQDTDTIEWIEDPAVKSWNVYRGDLAVLRASGVYTQAPGSNPLAEQHCEITGPTVDDTPALDPGQAAFYLVSALVQGLEGGLGSNSAGADRANANPCP